MTDYPLLENISENISHVIVGKKDSIELMLVALLGEGHILLEDVPGVGKTILAKSLARTMGGTFKRVQFTPDLLPADITGFNAYNQLKGQFQFHAGPVMTNVFLADEINRTIPRTQSSLLESMEERQVTVDGSTLHLPRPFFVMATQNPIELEGTFPLPEAQLDRFLLKIRLGYPDKSEEIAILERFEKEDPFSNLKAVANPEDITGLQSARKSIRISHPIREYITDIVGETRRHASLKYGSSPRGSIGLMRASQALAMLRGRDYILPDDIKHLAIPVLAHRLIVKGEDRIKGVTSGEILNEIIEQVRIPVGHK